MQSKSVVTTNELFQQDSNVVMIAPTHPSKAEHHFYHLSQLTLNEDYNLEHKNNHRIGGKNDEINKCCTNPRTLIRQRSSEKEWIICFSNDLTYETLIY
jgi:hypothetical protein